MNKIVILQSCDYKYMDFVDITMKPNMKYAQIHNYTYKFSIGESAFSSYYNRHFMLRDELASGKYDWALWMDVDAMVHNIEITLESIIDESPDKMLICCQGGMGGEWDVNMGVFFLNLRHPLTRQFVDDAVIKYNNMIIGAITYMDDQAHVQNWLLERMVNEKISFLKRYVDSEHNKFNYGGNFIAHHLTASGTWGERLERLSKYHETENH